MIFPSTQPSTFVQHVNPINQPDEKAGGPWHYRAYGLMIRSNLQLPEFEQCQEAGEPNVIVSWTVGNLPPSTEKGSLVISRREAVLNVPSIGSFSVRDGREILTRSRLGVDPTILRLYVEGMIMAALLYQRGLQVLHASVIKIDEGAIALMGHCGAGKSSTAAALHARGHAVVADDNAALDYREGRVHVQPAFPYLKMFPEISEFLGYDKENLQPLHDAAEKQGQSVSPQFPQTSIPLKGIYFLSRDAEEGFRRLTKAQAIIEVIRNSVPTRWAQPADCFHLQQSAQLTQALPFFRVRTFSTLSELPLLAASIEGHSRQALAGL